MDGVAQVQAVEVDILEFEARADVMVEQRELDAELAQCSSDLGGQLLAASDFLGAVRISNTREDTHQLLPDALPAPAPA